MRYDTHLKLIRLDDGFEAICRVEHPMKSGVGTTNHYIKSMEFRLNDRLVAEVLIGKNGTPNPLVGIHVSQAGDGDVVQVQWEDSHFNRGTAHAIVHTSGTQSDGAD